MGSGSRETRRCAAFVTQNACTKCRKKKIKCNGKTPCDKCLSKGDTDCIYKVSARQLLEDQRKEISQLRARQREIDQRALLDAHVQSEQVFYQSRDRETSPSLIAHRQIPLISAVPTHVATHTPSSNPQLSNNAPEPAQNLGKGALANQPFQEPFKLPSQILQSYPSEPGSAWKNYAYHQSSVINWTTDLSTPIPFLPCYASAETWSGQLRSSVSESISPSARRQGQDINLGHRLESGSSEYYHLSQHNGSWTTVTSDTELVEHLLGLYFCWEYPIFAPLSRQQFLEDFRQGTPRYCSPLLVNALLALASRWSDRPNARADPADNATAGDHFFSEALKLFKAEKNHRVLTTIQALGIMSIREASCGRASESIFFSGQSIRLAIEMGLHLDAEDGRNHDSTDIDHAVRGATFWGAFSLDEAWSLCSGKVPHFSLSTNLTVKPTIIREVESQPWMPYTDDGVLLRPNCSQLSNLRSVYQTFYRLSEIVHRTLYTLYTPGSHTGSEVLHAYHQYIFWYDTIPDALRLGDNSTPAVLFTHLYYHFAILMLFRPFVRFRIIASDVSPYDICFQAADTISTIISSYSNLYTLRRTPSFVPYIVLSSSVFYLTIGHDDTTSAYRKRQLTQNISDLRELSGCHSIAARAIDLLRFLAQLWEVDDIFDDTYEGEHPQNRSHPSFLLMDELSPLTGSVSMMHNIEEDGFALI